MPFIQLRANRTVYKVVNYTIASIWLINGLFCKVIGLVPRHEQIVAGILGHDNSGILTKLIGVSEILMAAWIISGIHRNFNAQMQILVITAMNILEFILVPELLLFGRLNAVFALILITVIYINEFILKPDTQGDAGIS